MLRKPLQLSAEIQETCNMKVLKPRTATSYGSFPAKCAADAFCSQLPYASQTYDSVMLLGLAAKATQENGQTMFANIKTTGTDYEGASGKITFTENGDITGSGYDICIFQNGDQECNAVWPFP